VAFLGRQKSPSSPLAGVSKSGQTGRINFCFPLPVSDFLFARRLGIYIFDQPGLRAGLFVWCPDWDSTQKGILIPLCGVPLRDTKLWHSLCTISLTGVLHHPPWGWKAAARATFKRAAFFVGSRNSSLRVAHLGDVARYASCLLALPGALHDPPRGWRTAACAVFQAGGVFVGVLICFCGVLIRADPKGPKLGAFVVASCWVVKLEKINRVKWRTRTTVGQRPCRNRNWQ
jgi:hypothetical protein